MEMPKEFYDMVCSDIKRIEESDNLSSDDRLKLHREIDGRYQACVRNWFSGLRGANANLSEINYGRIMERPLLVKENLEMMKGKLDTYKHQMNAIAIPEPATTNVTVNNTVNIAMSFEEAKQKIEDMTALNREQTDEILAKIGELEEISKEKTSRKTKWEKVKPIIAFALDKGADVAVAILSLVLQMKLGINP